MKMEVLHCLTVEGVLKELAMFALVYGVALPHRGGSAQGIGDVRAGLQSDPASGRQEVATERISFVDALRWLRSATPSSPLRDLVLVPDRPNRIEPRALKRRPKEYDRMTRPRGQMRKRLLRSNVAA